MPDLRERLAGRRSELIVNLAAAGVRPEDRSPAALIDGNVVLPGQLTAAAAGAGIRGIIHFGSSAEYAASTEELLSEDAVLERERLYGATKAAGSLLVTSLGTELDVATAVLRPFNVYGPGEQEHRLFPTLVRRLARGERVPLSAGTQVRDFVHVDDVCLAVERIATSISNGAVRSGYYNVATGVGTRVADFARRVARALDADESLLDFGALPLRPDDLPFVVGRADRIARAAGWRATVTLEEGIRDSIAEMRRPMGAAP
jgi:nucleoside-diphosphate-sugar epimerase